MIARTLMTGLLGLLAAFGSAPLGAKDEPSVLRVVAYNIKHGRGMDGKVDLERTAKVIESLKPDLVALQEVDKHCQRSGNRDLAAELAKRLGMESRFGKFMDYQGGEYGLAVLSRLPIVESTRHPLPTGSEPRCALEVQVRVEGRTEPISFVSIHHDWKSEEVRVRQVTALKEAMAPRKHPVILAGDFNGDRSDASMKLLAEAGWRIVEKNEGTPAKTCPSDEPKSEIDFFVLRGFGDGPIDHRVIDEKLASDHRPIVATIPLQP